MTDRERNAGYSGWERGQREQGGKERWEMFLLHFIQQYMADREGEGVQHKSTMDSSLKVY